jgi:hypothetical protein
VTNPNLASCVRAAVTVAVLALTVATGGAGAVVDVGVNATADAATDAAVYTAADATEDVADESGGGGLDKLEETASDVWETVKPKDTTRPGLQLVLGGVGGGIGNSPMTFNSTSQYGRSWVIHFWAPVQARSATWVAKPRSARSS